jgi:hypothetical protein
MSNAVNTAIYQYAQLSNPWFNGFLTMQGLKLNGVAGASPIFDVGMIQHSNILKIAVSSAYTTPSDLETKFIIDSTVIYMKANT